MSSSCGQRAQVPPWVAKEMECSSCKIIPYPFVHYCKQGHVMCPACGIKNTICRRKEPAENNGEECGELVIRLNVQCSLHNLFLKEQVLTVEKSPTGSASSPPGTIATAEDAESTSSGIWETGRCIFQNCPFILVGEQEIVTHSKNEHHVEVILESVYEMEVAWNQRGRRIETILQCLDGNNFLVLVEERVSDIRVWVTIITESSRVEDFWVKLRLQKSGMDSKIVPSLQWEGNPRSCSADDCLTISKSFLLNNLVSKKRKGEPETSSVFVSISKVEVPISQPGTPAPTSSKHLALSKAQAEGETSEIMEEEEVEEEQEQGVEYRTPVSSSLARFYEAEFQTPPKVYVQEIGFVNRNFPNYVLKKPDTNRYVDVPATPEPESIPGQTNGAFPISEDHPQPGEELGNAGKDEDFFDDFFCELSLSDSEVEDIEKPMNDTPKVEDPSAEQKNKSEPGEITVEETDVLADAMTKLSIEPLAKSVVDPLPECQNIMTCELKPSSIEDTSVVEPLPESQNITCEPKPSSNEDKAVVDNSPAVSLKPSPVETQECSEKLDQTRDINNKSSAAVVLEPDSQERDPCISPSNASGDSLDSLQSLEIDRKADRISSLHRRDISKETILSSEYLQRLRNLQMKLSNSSSGSQSPVDLTNLTYREPQFYDDDDTSPESIEKGRRAYSKATSSKSLRVLTNKQIGRKAPLTARPKSRRSAVKRELMFDSDYSSMSTVATEATAGSSQFDSSSVELSPTATKLFSRRSSRGE